MRTHELLEFSVSDVGEAVSCAPTFRAKVDNWHKNPVQTRDINIEDIKKKLERAQLKRKARSRSCSWC
jgi:hypothetical protein